MLSCSFFHLCTDPYPKQSYKGFLQSHQTPDFIYNWLKIPKGILSQCHQLNNAQRSAKGQLPAFKIFSPKTTLASKTKTNCACLGTSASLAG